MAIRYRKIDPRIWNDEKFRTFTDDSKLAFLFLLTHPHLTALGAMRAHPDGLARELGWRPTRLRAALAPARQHRMVAINEAAAFVGLPHFLKYNEPEGPNSVTRAWPGALDLLPECPEKRALIARCRAYLDAKSDAFRHAIGDAILDAFADAMSDASREPSPILEQEQEQEQEQERVMQNGGTPPHGSPMNGHVFAMPPGLVAALTHMPLLGPGLRDPAWWQAEYRAHPALDPAAEALKAEAWCRSNPSRAPKKSARRFLHAWLMRAEESR